MKKKGEKPNGSSKPMGGAKEQEGLVAVLIGIDGYYGELNLHCAVNDAVYLQETLLKVWQGRSVRINTVVWPSLNSDKAKTQQDTWGIKLPKDASNVTREGILSTVREWAALASESDTFLVFFAGHGVLTEDEPAIVAIGEGKTAEGIELIKIKEIQQAAEGCAARHKVMILDCCQNTIKRRQEVRGYKNLKELTREWSILISSSPGERSLEDQYFGDTRDDYLQQGVFTACLVLGLRGEAADRDGPISLAELAFYVGKRVPIEYQERMELILLERGRQVKTGNTASMSQNPVLLSSAVAMGGLYRVIMAPTFVPPAHDARRKISAKNFLKKWFHYMLREWPIMFPYRWAFRLAGLLYAAAMALTILWQFPGTINSGILLFTGAASIGSVLVWWVTLPFAAAANEERWHMGGYVVGLFYLAWHSILFAVFSILWGDTSMANGAPPEVIYLSIDLFFLMAGVIVFGGNPSHTIIALSETIRQDDRREIRQAIRAFQQFRYKRLGVDLYNSIATVTVRPDLYFIFWVIAMAVCIFNVYQVMIAAEVERMRMIIFVARNLFSMLLVSWLVFWYHAAFKFIQKEVYKR